MNTIFFELEEHIRKRKLFIMPYNFSFNMFDEIILQNIPELFNYILINDGTENDTHIITTTSTSTTSTTQNISENNETPYQISLKYREEYYTNLRFKQKKLFTRFVYTEFFKKLFMKTNYHTYQHNRYFDKTYKKFNIKLDNSITLFNIFTDPKYFNIDYQTNEKKINNMNINENFDFIVFSYRADLEIYDYYNICINAAIELILTHLNKKGNIILETNILMGDFALTTKYLTFLSKNFEHVYLSYIIDPLLLSIAVKIICLNKSESNKLFNSKTLDKLYVNVQKIVDYNYNFLYHFLDFDDIVRESIIYKLMGKF